MKFLPISEDILGSVESAKTSFIKSQGADFAEVFADQISSASERDLVAASNDPALAESFNLSREDVLGLMNQLAEQGISDDRLARLKELLNSGESITPRSVAEALRKSNHKDADGNPAFALSDGDRQQLNMFLRKLGFSEDDAAAAVAHLEGGGDINVWVAIAQRLSRMNPEEAIDVSASEIDVLGRAFRLNGQQRDILNKLFAGEDKQLSPESLKSALATLAQEMAQRNKSDAKLNQALEDSLGKIRQALLDRQKIEDAANNRGSKEALQKEAMFKDSATAKADGMAPLPAKGKNAENLKDYAQSMTEKIADAAKEAALQNNGQDKVHPHADRDFADHNFDPRQQYGRQNQTGTGKGQAESGQLAGRASDKQAVVSAESLTARTDFAVQMNFTQAAQHTAAEAKQNAAFAQQVFQQVENGMLRSLADGTKQLNIQLTPENLGTVTVLLSMKNKELTAIIRPENPEAAKAIEDQLHNLRLTLEQQGLKVERLEVRQQLQDSTSQPWQGFDQNQGQEMQHKSKEERLADLFRGRPLNLEENVDDPAAMPPTLGAHSAGLDIIA